MRGAEEQGLNAVADGGPSAAPAEGEGESKARRAEVPTVTKSRAEGRGGPRDCRQRQCEWDDRWRWHVVDVGTVGASLQS